MSLLSSVVKWGEFLKSPSRRRKPADRSRLCRFEMMEPRQLMTASPIAPQIHLGSVFFDPAPGKDTTPNTIQITFQGGEPNTQMTQLIVDGSANQNGLAVGDIVWNTTTDPVQIVSSQGFTVTSTTVVNGGSQIIFNLSGFVSGDSLTFTANADEVVSVNAQGVATTAPLTKGNDFQNAHLVGTFTAPHYENVTVNTAYVAGYNNLFTENNTTSGSTLDLPPQNYEPPSTTDQSDQTAGANVLVTQTPLPISIGGTVYDDGNFDNLQDNGEKGVGNVTLTLMEYNGTSFQSTGITTTTDANGNYLFQFLLPGTYEVDETVPSGYFAESAQVGTVAGTTDGSVLSAVAISQIAVLGGDNSVQNNFALVQGASISGNVSDCLADQALSGVTVELLNSSGKVIETTTTDSSGNYQFTGLQPNAVYGVEQILPNGYLNHDAWAGSVGGSVAADFDSITQVSLGDGVAATAYNFCDVLPASISGNVGDCDTGASLAGVTMELLNSNGKIIETTTTDESGNYSFTGLMPGQVYGVEQVLPAGYMYNDAWAGSEGGTVATDFSSITQVSLGDGVAATAYNFCDVQPVGISGYVEIDTTGHPTTATNLKPLPGVTVSLLDSNGDVIATTTTDQNGFYQFTNNLPPGTYGVSDVTPSPYFSEEADAGSFGGTVENVNLIDQVTLTSGEVGTNYNFYVDPPATISGIVFQDGPPITLAPGQSLTTAQVAQYRTGVYQSGDKLLAGVTLYLYGSDGSPIIDFSTGQQMSATTDANGFYEFTDLPGDQSYSVAEEPLSSQPEVSSNSAQGEVTILGLTAAGTTGGTADNPGNTINQQAISALGLSPDSTAVVEIPLAIGGTSANNNFSVVVTQTQQTPPPPPPPPPPPSPPPLVPPSPLPILYVPPVTPVSFVSAPITPSVERFDLPGGGGEMPYTWHLSVMDDGQPRESDPPDAGILSDSGPLVFDQSSWDSMNLNSSRWIVNDGTIKPNVDVFGTPGAIPVYGDFVGNGTTQMGVFIDGEWFIDANGDGKWDDGDLYAKLGNAGDSPVVGDWDGDGKDDIGVFGPEWLGDERPLHREPGLPKPMNTHRGPMKNMPPMVRDAASQNRTVMREHNGKLRADVIDHVFQFGHAGDVPVVGDWTGSGVRSVGIFRDGVWYLDIHGTGKWEADDIQAQFGQPGDIPIVGDWDGSGRDSIGVYRDGVWILDTNHDFRMDSGDKTFRFGQHGDRPVVGNFTGKAHTQIGVYRNGVLERPTSTAQSNAANLK